RRAGHPVLVGVFGIGCDAELTPDEVLERLGWVAAAGGLAGARGLTEPVATCLEQAIELVPTEASAQAVRAFRGAFGTAAMRRGGGELAQELGRGLGHRVHGALECRLIALRGTVESADLPHVLERGRPDLLVGRRRFEVVKGSDVSAHDLSVEAPEIDRMNVM